MNSFGRCERSSAFNSWNDIISSEQRDWIAYCLLDDNKNIPSYCNMDVQVHLHFHCPIREWPNSVAVETGEKKRINNLLWSRHHVIIALRYLDIVQCIHFYTLIQGICCVDRTTSEWTYVRLVYILQSVPRFYECSWLFLYLCTYICLYIQVFARLHKSEKES